jgi:hypothetical protein
MQGKNHERRRHTDPWTGLRTTPPLFLQARKVPCKYKTQPRVSKIKKKKKKTKMTFYPLWLQDKKIKKEKKKKEKLKVATFFFFFFFFFFLCLHFVQVRLKRREKELLYISAFSFLSRVFLLIVPVPKIKLMSFPIIFFFSSFSSFFS